MKVALVIGHKKTSSGAYNKELDITEYTLNEQEALKVARMLSEEGIAVEVIYRSTYKQLPAKINKHRPDIIVSFHHNSYNETSTGTETLYYHTSHFGKRLATTLQSKIVNALGYTDRGIKPKSSEDRGGYVLRYTNAPCVILEPCFMSNTQELQDFMSKQDVYCRAIVDAIKEFMQ